MSAKFAPDLDEPHSFRCPQTGKELVHVFDAPQVRAIRLALTLNRPLLVRGEPGAGKSQLARAAADVLDRPFRCRVVDGQTESRDLLYELDLVQRLADAQARGSAGGSELDLGIENYLSAGPMWWALDRTGARRLELGRARRAKRDVPAEPQAGAFVVLIDEIDKADPSVPNGLLEVLADDGFEVPGLARVKVDTGARPLVVITTNEERALPRAFLRRCVVLHLELPREQAALKEWLVARGRAHWPKMEGTVLLKAAEQLAKDRVAAKRLNLYAPGQAEYLDLLQAIQDLAGDSSSVKARSDAQLGLLEELGEYLLVKEKERQ